MRVVWLITLYFAICRLSYAETDIENRGNKEYEIEIIADVEYVKDGSKAQRLDIIRPKVKMEIPMPVIVRIHGGSWAYGDKKPDREYIIPFARKGYFGVSINYRLSDEAIFPAQIEDCKCAIRFLRAHAKEYNIDPNRIGVFGGSAGGHLAALLGTAGNIKEFEGKGGWDKYPSHVQAVCEFYGPVDITKMKHLPKTAKFIGGDVDKKHDIAVKASPITYITKDDPPFLIFHGEKDKVVPIEHSLLFEKKLKQSEVYVELIVFEGAGHGGEDFKKQETKDKVMSFFDRYLKYEAK